MSGPCPTCKGRGASAFDHSSGNLVYYCDCEDTATDLSPLLQLSIDRITKRQALRDARRKLHLARIDLLLAARDLEQTLQQDRTPALLRPQAG